eukprot:TRINITY_DN23568_c0_g2_i1.p1 TRINITY_DN23568_c0_g2~~TRINITY_DN23568_c0_g2_i1.p1  ORF type:complete len:517 (+),score=32.81 TRINITY_DN23568_c0_g2_i1:106-1551(+)
MSQQMVQFARVDSTAAGRKPSDSGSCGEPAVLPRGGTVYSSGSCYPCEDRNFDLRLKVRQLEGVLAAIRAQSVREQMEAERREEEYLAARMISDDVGDILDDDEVEEKTPSNKSFLSRPDFEPCERCPMQMLRLYSKQVDLLSKQENALRSELWRMQREHVVSIELWGRAIRYGTACCRKAGPEAVLPPPAPLGHADAGPSPKAPSPGARRRASPQPPRMTAGVMHAIARRGFKPTPSQKARMSLSPPSSNQRPSKSSTDSRSCPMSRHSHTSHTSTCSSREAQQPPTGQRLSVPGDGGMPGRQQSAHSAHSDDSRSRTSGKSSRASSGRQAIENPELIGHRSNQKRTSARRVPQLARSPPGPVASLGSPGQQSLNNADAHSGARPLLPQMPAARLGSPSPRPLASPTLSPTRELGAMGMTRRQDTAALETLSDLDIQSRRDRPVSPDALSGARTPPLSPVPPNAVMLPRARRYPSPTPGA